MATLVLQAVGGLVGGLLGPVGAAIGAAAGAMGGYMVDTALINSTRRIEGPRLANAKAMTAEEGAALPFIYGTMRVAGTLIWATRFEESKTTTRQGGKGGPKVSTYSYFANAAFSVAEGEIAGIRRIWADGKEIDLTNVEIRVHRGSQSQQPDPLIEARQGQGNAPAYRGTAYVVFERLPVEEYGNRLPQFQFEVMRPVGSLNRNITAVALLPGATEFGLAPYLVSDEPVGGEKRLINRNMIRGQTDWAASIDELQALCPNLQHVAIIVPWFGNDLRAGLCELRPGVTDHTARRPSHAWKVADVARDDAHLISRSGEGFAYGGTPSDDSVIAAIRDARARGLKVTLYPFIMMDVANNNALPSPYGGQSQSPYPWRGRITCHPASGQTGSPDMSAVAGTQVGHFLNGPWGYRRFLTHCASLAVDAGGVDAFLIGSELIGLTCVRAGRESFPFVDGLCTLAGEMRNRLGPNCQLTYGADWSEYFGYHPQDGSGDVYFHLDPLWAHPAIDAVGIDNYMPLSDWRDGDMQGGNPDGFDAAYDIAALRSQIAAGEGFDWYYANSSDRQARKRSPISDGMAGKPWVFRYKDLKSWWQNPHYNRVGGVERVSKTAWVAMSKPLWFTELGCPAADKGPNQPNVFPDPKSSESASPYFSDGSRSDLAMNRFLRAHLDHWKTEGQHNPVSPLYGGTMLDRSRIYLWAWDTRPFPEFPLFGHIWGDADNWSKGHWLNGRISGVSLDELIAAILQDFGLQDLGLPSADTQAADGYVSGFVISDPTTTRAVLEQLLEIFGVHAFEDAGRFIFRSIARAAPSLLVDQAMVMPNEGEPLAITLDDRSDLPGNAALYYHDPLRSFQAAGKTAIRFDARGQGDEALSLSGAIEGGQAQALVEAWLNRRWAERRDVGFALPWSAADLHVGDRVRLPVLEGERDYVVTGLDDGEVRAVRAVALAPAIHFPDHATLPPPDSTRPVIDVKPAFHLVDLPLWPGVESPEQQFRIACHAKPWRGVAVYASPQADDFAERTLVGERATMGELLEPFPAGPSGRLLMAQHLDVLLYSGELQSRAAAQIFNGANTALVQSADGAWEVLQFLNAEEIALNRWRLSGLLRGQLGTEQQASAAKIPEAPFILLDDGVVSSGLLASEISLPLNWRIGTAGRAFSDEYFDTVQMAGGVRALMPLAPVHLRASKTDDGDMAISWIRRGRIDADSWLGEDIPIGEERELYRIEVIQNGIVVRHKQVTTPAWAYPKSMRLQDLNDISASFEIAVSMVSAQIGAGVAASIIVTP